MAINTLEFVSLVMKALDQQIVAESTTGWMEQNAGQVIYNGGREVKIPTLDMDGLADYDRDNGFTRGGVKLSYQTKAMTMDRGRSFQLDAMDVNETNFVANATAVMSAFQRQYVIPEIDAYRYAKIYQLVAAGKFASTHVTKTKSYTASNILSAIKEDKTKIEDITGDSVTLIASIPTTVLAMLENSTEISKQIRVEDFSRGQINTKVRMIDNLILKPVPSGRMKTAYNFYKGEEDSEDGTDRKKGGFEATAEAKQINWIITPATVPVAISKTDKIRVFDPNTNQSHDAWKMDYRKYHDLWIKDNELATVVVNTQ